MQAKNKSVMGKEKLEALIIDKTGKVTDGSSSWGQTWRMGKRNNGTVWGEDVPGWVKSKCKDSEAR